MNNRFTNDTVFWSFVIIIFALIFIGWIDAPMAAIFSVIFSITLFNLVFRLYNDTNCWNIIGYALTIIMFVVGLLSCLHYFLGVPAINIINLNLLHNPWK
jgi:hypothetical protein